MKVLRLKKYLWAQLPELFKVRSYDRGRRLEIQIPSILEKSDIYPLYLDTGGKTWHLTDDGLTLEAMEKYFEGRHVFQRLRKSETFTEMIHSAGLSEKEGVLTRPTVLDSLAKDLIRFMLRLGTLWDHVHLIVRGREMETAGIYA